MAYTNLPDLIDKSLLNLFKTQLDAELNAALAEKETLGTAATLVGSLSSLSTTAKGNVVAAINEVKSSLSTTQSTLNTLSSSVDTIKNDYLTSTDKSSLQNQITTNKNNIATNTTDIANNTAAIAALNGTGSNSVDAKITAAINKFATDVTDDGVVNSYKELIDYAAEHGSETTQILADIATNKNNIATNTTNIATNTSNISALSTKVGTIPSSSSATTVTGYVDEQISSYYAIHESDVDTLQKSIDSLNTRVTALETWASSASLATEADILAMFN